MSKHKHRRNVIIFLNQRFLWPFKIQQGQANGIFVRGIKLNEKCTVLSVTSHAKAETFLWLHQDITLQSFGRRCYPKRLTISEFNIGRQENYWSSEVLRAYVTLGGLVCFKMSQLELCPVQSVLTMFLYVCSVLQMLTMIVDLEEDEEWATADQLDDDDFDR